MSKSIRDVLEIVTAVLLGLVSVATALGAYQAAVWAGQAAEHASTSQQLRDRNLSEFLSSQLIYKDDGGKLLDLVGLGSEMNLYPERTLQLQLEQNVLLQSASPELSEAWETWVASGYQEDLIPMASADYEAALFSRPQSMRYASFVADQAAEAVEAKANQVTLASVTFAVALLLLGIAGVNSSWKVTAALAGAATLAFLGGVVIVLFAAIQA